MTTGVEEAHYSKSLTISFHPRILQNVLLKWVPGLCLGTSSGRRLTRSGSCLWMGSSEWESPAQADARGWEALSECHLFRQMPVNGKLWVGKQAASLRVQRAGSPSWPRFSRHFLLRFSWLASSSSDLHTRPCRSLLFCKLTLNSTINWGFGSFLSAGLEVNSTLSLRNMLLVRRLIEHTVCRRKNVGLELCNLWWCYLHIWR